MHQRMLALVGAAVPTQAVTIAVDLAIGQARHGHGCLRAYKIGTRQAGGRVARPQVGLHPGGHRCCRSEQAASRVHQRIGLARALALDPEVLLIDNPLGGVDPRQGRWWLDFLCEVKKSVTVVVSTDDFRAWTDVGTQSALLKERQLEIIGGRDEVRQSKDELVRELLTPAFES